MNITDSYVGSTTNFTKRKNGHKSDCNDANCKQYNFKLYKTIREKGGWNNWTMIEIEKYNCNDGHELRARERYYYELLQSNLNMQKPNGKTINEIKETKKIFQTHYYQNHKEKFLSTVERECECGCKIICQKMSNSKFQRHLQSKKHKTLINKLYFEQLPF